MLLPDAKPVDLSFATVSRNKQGALLDHDVYLMLTSTLLNDACR